MTMHLVQTFDGPFLCNGSRDGIWTYDPKQATCIPCLRRAIQNASQALKEIHYCCTELVVCHRCSDSVKKAGLL